MILTSVLPPLLSGWVLSFMMEYGLTPKPMPMWQRQKACLFVHIGLWSLVFALLVLILQRPWFAVVNLLAFQLLLVLVNQAKYDSLREPFIFQDFEYFTDAIKHPRLYLPFFGIARTIAATIGFVSAFVMGFVLEPSLMATLNLPEFLAMTFVLAVFAQQLFMFGLRYCPEINFQPAEDLTTLGLFAFYALYWRSERLTRHLNEANAIFEKKPEALSQSLPHIITVQSESFFDPRSLSAAIKPTVLKHFDHAQTEAFQYGRLSVPAWGANTVRTECGFLTALTPEQLGIHRFNPYRLLAHYNMPNLVSYLKQVGYRTVCIHPYHITFYLRNKVFPRMGFDELIDIRSFTEHQKSGQFIGDLAIADKIDSLLSEATSQPLFIFVITMENHGPLHLEQANFAEQAQFFEPPLEPVCNDLQVYLSHLQNADSMIKQLQTALLADARDGVLCWYGDHVPIMESVYQRFAEPDGLTDYFVWNTSKTTGVGKQASAIHELANILLKSAGLASS